MVHNYLHTWSWGSDDLVQMAWYHGWASAEEIKHKKISLLEPRREKTEGFACAKAKTQISCAVTAQLISAFVFATRIVQSLFFLNPNFQASSYLLWLYRPVCVRPGRKP